MGDHIIDVNAHSKKVPFLAKKKPIIKINDKINKEKYKITLIVWEKEIK